MQYLTETPSHIGEDRLREAFEYAASGMALTDLDGRFRESNPAYRQILGRSEQELESETILSVTHKEDRQHCEDQLNRLISGEISSFVVEKRYVWPSGEPIWVRNSFSLLKGRDGQPGFIILICNDMTERRRAEQLLIESEKLAVVGQLTSSIAHEINNPLESVLNLLYLARQADSLQEAQQFLTEAEEETQRIAKIALDTLRFRREQSKPDRTNLAELVESVLTLFQGKLNQSGIDLQLNRSDSSLICYPGEIRQILANLIRNAVEAMPNGGHLRIRVRPATDWRNGEAGVRITIADTGCGMDIETCRRIYEPFFTTKGNAGTGLGLWVTASILAKHRGSMHVRSSETPERSGTAFTLIFPYAGAEGKAAGLRDFH